MDLRYRIAAEERAALYNEVWTDPVTTVAKRYDHRITDCENIVSGWGFHCHTLDTGPESNRDKI